MDNVKKIIQILDKYEECQDDGLNVIVTDYGQKYKLAQDLFKLFATPDVVFSEAENCKHHPCQNGGHAFCDYPHCDQYEQGEAEVCVGCIAAEYRNEWIEPCHSCLNGSNKQTNIQRFRYE